MPPREDVLRFTFYTFFECVTKAYLYHYDIQSYKIILPILTFSSLSAHESSVESWGKKQILRAT